MSEAERKPLNIVKSILATLVATILFIVVTILGTFVGTLVGREAFFVDIAVPLAAAYVGPLSAVLIFKESCNYHIVGVGFILLALSLIVFYVTTALPLFEQAGFSQFERAWDTFSVLAILVGALIAYGKMWFSHGQIDS